MLNEARYIIGNNIIRTFLSVNIRQDQEGHLDLDQEGVSIFMQRSKLAFTWCWVAMMYNIVLLQMLVAIIEYVYILLDLSIVFM